VNEIESNKEFYHQYHDEIYLKRYRSPHPIRRKVHHEIYESVLQYVEPGKRVLDAGGGEGVLGALMALKGAEVSVLDLSQPNVDAGVKVAESLGADLSRLNYLVGDAEALPFENNSFDCVVSNHVLEHLPDFKKGLHEIYRVTNDRAVIAVPTCLNLCSLSLLGGAPYYTLTKRSLFAIPFGMARVLAAFATGQEGVNEGYAGSKDNVHIFRFPWRVSEMIREVGFSILECQAQTLQLPYFNTPIKTSQLRGFLWPFGLGTVYHVSKLKRRQKDS